MWSMPLKNEGSPTFWGPSPWEHSTHEELGSPDRAQVSGIMALYEDYAVCLKGIPVPSSIISFMKS